MVTQTESRTVWKLDPAHSVIEFSGRHMMVSTVKGRFKGASGTIVLDTADPSRSSVEAEIDTTTLDTGAEQRDNHLRSGDFLEIEKHPTISFKSTRVEPRGENQARVIGNLTIRGTTREVALDTEVSGPTKTPWGSELIGFEARTSINRKDFGLNWNVALEAGGFLVGDTVKIELAGEAIKQA
jgi:polyisoprenoid-binding protein YceI